jgi:hypothetical protein
MTLDVFSFVVGSMPSRDKTDRPEKMRIARRTSFKIVLLLPLRVVGMPYINGTIYNLLFCLCSFSCTALRWPVVRCVPTVGNAKKYVKMQECSIRQFSTFSYQRSFHVRSKQRDTILSATPWKKRSRATVSHCHLR